MIGCAALNTIAQTLLKAGAGHGLINPQLVGGLGAYGMSTLLYVIVLGRMNVSFAYPVVIGATVVSTCLAGARIFREGLGSWHWVGIALIIVGIACIALSRRTVA
jgi:multidrug transporter EmrE-like cation transporter